MPPAENFDQIRATVRLVAKAVGEQARGEALIAHMDAELAELAAHRPHHVLTVAEWGGGGYVPGRGGLFDTILTAAGARNVERGSFGYYDVESLIAANPDALIYGDTYAGTTSLRADQDLHPALMQRYAGRRISIQPALWLRRAGKRGRGQTVARRAQEAPMKLNLSLLILIVLAFAASLLAGRVWLPPASLLAPHDSLAGLIIYDVRLPRTVLALIVGAVLGLSGAVLQGFTRNPLAEPGLLGVSSGAALGAVIAIYFGLAALSPVTGPLLGMIGALAACALTFALGRNGTVALVLAGAAVSSLTAAGIALALELRAQSLCRLRDHDLAAGFAGRQELDPSLAGPALCRGRARRCWPSPAGRWMRCPWARRRPKAWASISPVWRRWWWRARRWRGRDHLGHRRHRLYRPGGAASGAALCRLCPASDAAAGDAWPVRCCCSAPTSRPG